MDMYNWHVIFISKPVPEVPMVPMAKWVGPTDTSGQASITVAPGPPLYYEPVLACRPDAASARTRPPPTSRSTARCISLRSCTVRVTHNSC